MNTAKLRRALARIASECSTSVSCINYGGCGVFAALVANKLAERGIEFHIKVLSVWGVHDLHEVRLEWEVMNTGPMTSVRDWNDCGVSVRHIALHIPRLGEHVLFDSDGIAQVRDDDPGHIGELSLTELNTIADNPTGWNHCFNRLRIPTLRRIVDEHLPSLIEQAA